MNYFPISEFSRLAVAGTAMRRLAVAGTAMRLET